MSTFSVPFACLASRSPASPAVATGSAANALRSASTEGLLVYLYVHVYNVYAHECTGIQALMSARVTSYIHIHTVLLTMASTTYIVL